MSRMSREFSLVLLGSGLLSAGYFTAPSPEEEMDRKSEEQAADMTGNNSNQSRGYRPGMFFLFLHSPYYGGGSTNGRPAAYSPTTRAGGLGAAGRAFSGGGS